MSDAKADNKRVFEPLTLRKVAAVRQLLDELITSAGEILQGRGKQWRDLARDGSTRELTPLEAAQIAVCIDPDEPVEDRVQSMLTLIGSDLRAQDDPGSVETAIYGLLGAGDLLLDSALAFTLLVEDDGEAFRSRVQPSLAPEKQRILDCYASEIEELRDAPVSSLRDRLVAAMEHAVRDLLGDSAAPKDLARETVTGLARAAIDRVQELQLNRHDSSLISSPESTEEAR